MLVRVFFLLDYCMTMFLKCRFMLVVDNCSLVSSLCVGRVYNVRDKECYIDYSVSSLDIFTTSHLVVEVVTM